MTNFPSSYISARTQFVEMARAKGYGLATKILPHLRGPAGEELACDIAFRKSGKRAVVATTSAVHGIEGPAGSALQIEWMRSVDAEALNCDVMHIHALNPFGYAWAHRSDQDNVDVNRNAVAAFPVVDANPRYRDFRSVIVPQRINLRSKLLMYTTILQNGGVSAMKDILSKGQYEFPEGMFYGGSQTSWSRKVWEGLIVGPLSSYARVVHDDLHTGLGKRGDLQIIYPGSRHGKGYDFVAHTWSQDLIGVMSDNENNSVSSVISGDISNSFALTGRSKIQDITSVTFEFGTVAPLKVFDALQQDHVARAYGPYDAVTREKAYLAMCNAFAPQDVNWEASVMEKGTQAYRRLIHALG